MNYITIYLYLFLLNLLCFPIITFDISPFCCCCNQPGSYKETRYTITHSEKIIHTSTTTGDNENIDYTNFKQIHNFKDDCKYIRDKSNFYYNKLLEKYLAGRKVDSIETTLMKDSVHCCVKVKINNSDVVYIKEDKKINELYIDILKHLDYCELDYLYEGDYILTREVQHNINFDLKYNQSTIDTIYNVYHNTENLLPYFTIGAFLRLKGCGINLNDNQFKINENGKYTVKALDVNSCEYNFDLKWLKSYDDFYWSLNSGFRAFSDIKGLFIELKQYEVSDLKKFYYSLHAYPEVLVRFFSEESNNEIEKFTSEEEDVFFYLHSLCSWDELKKYLESKGFIDNECKYIIKYTQLLEIFKDKYKNNFKEFLIDYLKYIKDNFGEYHVFNDEELIAINATRGTDIYETCYNVMLKLFEKTDKCFKLLHNFEKLWNIFGDLMIEEINKGSYTKTIEEIKIKFKQMQKFLSDNKDNPKYDKNTFKKIEKDIEVVRESGLFNFLFS